MKNLSKVNQLLAILERLTLFISGLSIMAMMLLVTIDVILRNIFSSSIPGSYEISEKYLMPLIIFPILYYVYNSNSLPNMDFILTKLKLKIRNIVQIITYSIEILIFIALTIFSWQKAIVSTNELLAFPAAGKMLPLYPFYYLVPLGFGLLAIGVLLKFTIFIGSKVKSTDTQSLKENSSVSEIKQYTN